MKNLSVYLLLSVLFLVARSPAEIRTWKDASGNNYEADYVRELFNKVTLRTADGTELRIPVEKLSEHDQKYLRVMVAPEVEIHFSKKTRTEPKPVELLDDDNDTTTLMKPSVTVRKVSKRPFTSALKMELFLIAKEVDGKNYILLENYNSKILFHSGNDYSFTFSPPQEVRSVIYTGHDFITRRGEEYLGYLVVLTDPRDVIVKISSNIREWIQSKEVIENLRELAVRSAPSRRSRHFDKRGQKSPVPRQPYYQNRKSN